MEKKKPEIDIVNEILEECIMAYPVSSFVISLYKQYLQRGSLSKKQLQGLFGKASKIDTLAAGKLATLEALIHKMPTRLKSEAPAIKPMFQQDEVSGALLNKILAKYPSHKTAVFLKAKYDNMEILTATEVNDIRRFAKNLKV
jgi:hypothetical protein